MSRLLRYVTPKDSEGWGNRVDVKVNGSMFRKLTRTRKGNGREFSPEQFDSVVLEEGIAFIVELANTILPQKTRIQKQEITLCPSKDIEAVGNKMERHLKIGVGPIGFITNQAQFQMEALRYLLKLRDDREIATFINLYRRANIQTTGDFINFLQNFIDTHQEE